MADTCAACGGPAGGPSARWCGRCGARLGPPRQRAQVGARRADGSSREHALVGAGTTVLLDDQPEAEEVAPSNRAWSPRARAAAAAGVLLVLVAALVARPEPVVEYEARGFTARGDASRSGVVSLAPLDAPTRVAWSADVGAAVTATGVRAAGDLVLERTRAGIVAARAAGTGEVVWLRRDVAGGGTPVRVGDTVVAVSADGPLRAFDVADGAERWSIDGVGPAEPWPMGSDVLLRSPERLVAVSAETGEVRWQLDGPGQLGGTIQAVVPGGAGLGVWFTSPPGLPIDSPRVTHAVGLLDPATGGTRFTRQLPSAHLGAPIAVGARAVAWIDGGDVVVADPDGQPVHRLDGLGAEGLVATGELLAVLRYGGSGVVGIDLRTGTERWVRPDVRTDALVAADGLVIAETGTVIDAGTGRSLSTQQRLTLPSIDGETSLLSLPAVGGSELEIRDRRGDIVVRVPLLPDESAAPAVGAGRVFVPTREGVEAYAVGDGTRDWEFSQLPATGLGTTHTPVVAATTVLVSPPDAFGQGPGLLALELSGGVRTWDRDGDTPTVRGPLTLAGDVAFVPVGAEVHGYDVVTGRRAFAAVAGTPRGELVVGPNRVIGGPAPGHAVVGEGPSPDEPEVVAILRRDRSENWRAPLSPCSGPVLAGERVAWGTREGVTALDERTGELAWQAPTAGPVCLDPVAAGGRIVVIADPATLVALPVAGGDPSWTRELPAPAVASPVVADEHLLVPLLDGTLAAYALADGSPAWTYELGGIADASPAVLDGHVLVHLRDGRLLALAP